MDNYGIITLLPPLLIIVFALITKTVSYTHLLTEKGLLGHKSGE